MASIPHQQVTVRPGALRIQRDVVRAAAAGPAAVRAGLPAAAPGAPICIAAAAHPGAVADLLAGIAGEVVVMGLAVAQRVDLTSAGPHVSPARLRIELEIDDVRMKALHPERDRVRSLRLHFFRTGDKDGHGQSSGQPHELRHGTPQRRFPPRTGYNSAAADRSSETVRNCKKAPSSRPYGAPIRVRARPVPR